MKIFIKKIILLALLLLPQVIHSQDLIILRNGKEIPCKITRIDSVNLFYDFIRGERTLSSYINKDEVKSYTRTAETIYAPGTGPEKNRSEKVIIDTTEFVRPSYSWNNLLTYSRRLGAYANGWAVSYYGFVNYDQSKWIIPCKFSIENFIIHSFPKDVYVYHSYEIYYGEQEFSTGAAVGAQFGLIGALATSGIKTPGTIRFEVSDLKLYRKDGTLIKDIGSFYKEYNDEFKADAYCWCIYWNVNEKLKDFNAHLIEKIRMDLSGEKFL